MATTRPTAPLQTLVDAELSGMGPRVPGALAARDLRLSIGAPIGTVMAVQQQERAGLVLKTLTERHPDHLGEFWDECEALYRGGHHLLRNPAMMERLFPKHNNELPTIYADRQRRAFYIPYSGKIVDILTAGLEGDPIRLVIECEGEDGAKVDSQVPTDWVEWSERVTAPGADLEHTHSLHGIACEAIRMAQVKRDAWVLTDLPRVDPAAAAAVSSALEQEQLGVKSPYFVLVDPGEVIDWDHDDDGTLAWVMHHRTSRRRRSPDEGRGGVLHTWTIWDAVGWRRYELLIDPTKLPPAETVVPCVDEGEHPFGVVPWVRFSLPDGLWTMGKLESLAREHFNKRCAVGWAEYKALFAVLYEFLAAPQPGVKSVGGGAESDPNRATSQVRGQGWTQRRGEKDRAEFIGPDAGPFKEARESCAEMMQEMHRVTATMAASANMDSAALQRSAESKDDDRTDTKTVLEAFGMRGRKFVEALVAMRARGAATEVPDGMVAQGLESFDVESIDAKIAAVVELFAGVPILSPTFKRHVLGELYAAIMSDKVSPEALEEMREELRAAIEAEGVLIGMGPGGAGSLGGGDLPPGVVDPNAIEDDDETAGDKPAPKQGRPAPRKAKPKPAASTGPRQLGGGGGAPRR